LAKAKRDNMKYGITESVKGDDKMKKTSERRNQMKSGITESMECFLCQKKIRFWQRVLAHVHLECFKWAIVDGRLAIIPGENYEKGEIK